MEWDGIRPITQYEKGYHLLYVSVNLRKSSPVLQDTQCTIKVRAYNSDFSSHTIKYTKNSK